MDYCFLLNPSTCHFVQVKYDWFSITWHGRLQIFRAYCKKCLPGQHVQCWAWEMQCCDTAVLLLMCDSSFPKTANKANECKFWGNILHITKVTF